LVEGPERGPQRAEREPGHLVRYAVRDAREQPVRLDDVLRIGGGALPAAQKGGHVRTVLAMDIVTGHAERAAPAGVLRHDDHAVPNLHPAGLVHGHDLAHRLMAEVERLAARQPGFVLGTHRRDEHLDHSPVPPWGGIGNVHNLSLLGTPDDDLFQRAPLRAATAS